MGDRVVPNLDRSGTKGDRERRRLWTRVAPGARPRSAGFQRAFFRPSVTSKVHSERVIVTVSRKRA